MMARLFEGSLNSRLWEACLDGNVELVEKYIADGADIRWKGQGGKTPLAIAAYCNKSDVVEILLQSGANVDEVDEFNRSALHWAAQFGFVATAKVLLSYGANPSLPTKVSGSPPLLIAANTGQLNVLKLLVSKGASWNVKNNDGKLPIDIARTEKHDKVVEYLSQLDNSQKRLLEAFSNDLKICLKVTRMSIHGPPGSGKTCLQRLLLNESPPKSRESTGILTPAVRACATTLLQSVPHSSDGSSIKRVSEEEFLTRLSQRLNMATNVETASSLPSSESTSGRISESFRFRKLFQRIQKFGSRRTNASLSSPPPLLSSHSHSVNYEIVSRLPKESESLVDCEEQFKAHWIYCIDSGGQPAFQDIAPSFLRLNSINIITLRLIDELNHYPISEFVLCGQHFLCPNRQQFTTRQMIANFARSLLSVAPPTELSYVLSPPQPNLLVIGTFKDRMIECHETLQEKNRSLKEDLHSYKDMCIRTVEEEIIHPVNTLVDTGRTEVASYLSRIITRRSNFEVEVPFKWFCFHLEVVKEAKDRPFCILSREECLSIASGFDMTSTIEDALLFFDNLGTLLYFPAILQNVVFTDPDPLLKNISQLIYLTFLDKLIDLPDLHFSLRPNSHHELKDNGIFTEEVVSELCNGFVEHLFSARDFINLLLHLLIVGKISPFKYFIPCVLPWIPLTSDERYRFCKNVDPIAISWSETTPKPIPYGLFTGLVNILTDNKSFSLLEGSKEFRQRRNVIGFNYVQKGGWLILVDQVCYIEIFFTGLNTNCVEILDIVYKGLMKTTQTCRYHLESPRKGFYDQSCNHIHYTGYDAANGVTIFCHQNVHHLTCERCTPWFNNDTVSIDATTSSYQPKTVDNTPFFYYKGQDFSNVIAAVKYVVKWEELGHALFLDPAIIDQINKTHKGDVEECRKDIIRKWMMISEHSSWQTLYIAVYKEHPSLAQRIACEHPNREFRKPSSLSPKSHPSSLSSHPPSVSSHPPSISSHPPSFSPHPPSLSSHPPCISSHPPSLSSHASSVEYSKPEQVSLDSETVVSKTSDIYQSPHEERNDRHDCTRMI